MATLREAINIAKTEPTSQRSMQLMAAIHAGTMDKKAAEEGIDLTGFKQATAPHVVNNATNKQHALIQKVGSFLANPGQAVEGAALDLARQSATPILKTAVEYGKTITPEQAAADKEAEAQREATRQQQISRQQVADKKAASAGVVMPSEFKNKEGNAITDEEEQTKAREEFASTAENAAIAQNPMAFAAGKIGEAAGAALQQGAEGVQEMATPTKGGANVLPGFTKVASAIPGVIGAPVTAALSVTPKPVQDVANAGMQAVPNIAAYGLKNVLDPENKKYVTNLPGIAPMLGALEEARKLAGQTPGIDVNSDEYKQNIEEPIKQAVNWMMLRSGVKNAHEIGEGIVGGATKTAEAVKNVGKNIVEAPKTASDIIGRAQGKPTGNLGSDLRNLGVSEQHSGVLEARPDLTQTAAKYVEQGIKNLNNMAERKSVFEEPAKEVLTTRNAAKAQLRSIGESLDQLAEQDLGGKILDGSPIEQAINDIIAQKKINTKLKGGINNPEAFNKSTIIKDSPQAKAIIEAYNKFKNNKEITPNLNETLYGSKISGDSLVNFKKTLYNIVESSEDKNKAAGAIGPIIDSTQSLIHKNSSGAYRNANLEWSTLKTIVDKIDKAGNYVTSKGKSGFSAQQLLKRSLKEGSPIYREVLDSFKELEDKFGIEVPKDINYKAVLADMAEKITKSAPTKSFEPIIGGKAGEAIKGLGKLKQIVSPSRNILDNATKVLNVLKGDQEVGRLPNIEQNISAPTLKNKPLPATKAPTRFDKNMGEDIQHKVSDNGGKLSIGDNNYLKYSTDNDKFVIDNIDVKDGRKGIGTQLMKKAEEVAKDKGYDKIELGAFPQDERITSDNLVKFYEDLGYKVINEDEVFGDKYYDMVKHL